MPKVWTSKGVYRWNGHHSGEFKLDAPLELTEDGSLILPDEFARKCVPPNMQEREVELNGWCFGNYPVTMKWIQTEPRKLVLHGTGCKSLKLFVIEQYLEPGESMLFKYNGEGYFRGQSIGADGLVIEMSEIRNRHKRFWEGPEVRGDFNRGEVESITPPASPPLGMHDVIEISSDDSPPRPQKAECDSDSETDNVAGGSTLCLKKLSAAMMQSSLMYVPVGWNLGLGLPTKEERSKIWFTHDGVNWFGVFFVCNIKNRCFSSGFRDFITSAGFEEGQVLWFRRFERGIMVTRWEG